MQAELREHGGTLRLCPRSGRAALPFPAAKTGPAAGHNQQDDQPAMPHSALIKKSLNSNCRPAER